MTISSIMKMNKAVRDKLLSPQLIDKINLESQNKMKPADGSMVFNTAYDEEKVSNRILAEF